MLLAHLSSTSASQHSGPTTSSMPSPRGLVWPSSGGSKHEKVGAAALAPQTSPRATARDAMSERMVVTMLPLYFVVVLGKRQVVVVVVAVVVVAVVAVVVVVVILCRLDCRVSEGSLFGAKQG